jgi:hypothetical protein
VARIDLKNVDCGRIRVVNQVMSAPKTALLPHLPDGLSASIWEVDWLFASSLMSGLLSGPFRRILTRCLLTAESKKADAAEHLLVFNHVGLLSNGPPGTPGLPFI